MAELSLLLGVRATVGMVMNEATEAVQFFSGTTTRLSLSSQQSICTKRYLTASISTSKTYCATMADAIASVLDYETRLAFRRRTEKGWVPGLPKRKSKSEYSDYGEDGEILSALHSFFDAIKARFANRRNNKSFILTTMSINGEIAGVVKNSGPLLWPGEQGRTPSFIDPTFGLDFSIEEHKERYVA